MERPEKIYLTQPIKVLGIEVKHTEEGLRYLVDHFSHCLAISTAKQISKPDREHAQKIITQYKQHIDLYEQERIRTQGGTEEVRRPDGGVPEAPAPDSHP